MKYTYRNTQRTKDINTEIKKDKTQPPPKEINTVADELTNQRTGEIHKDRANEIHNERNT